MHDTLVVGYTKLTESHEKHIQLKPIISGETVYNKRLRPRAPGEGYVCSYSRGKMRPGFQPGPPCSLVSGLVGFWAINLPEIPWLLGELALPTQQIKFYISTYLLSFVLSLAEFSLVGVAKEAEIGGVVK